MGHLQIITVDLPSYNHPMRELRSKRGQQKTTPGSNNLQVFFDYIYSDKNTLVNNKFAGGGNNNRK